MAKINTQLHKVLENHIRFENLVFDISSRFVRLPFSKVNSELERALKQIIDFFEVECCELLGISEDKNYFCVTHDCYADGAKQVLKGINFNKLFPWGYDICINKGQTLRIHQMAQLPPEAKQDFLSWSARGVKSNLTIPLSSAKGIQHLIAIHSVHKEQDWPEEYILRLKLLGEILINALERRNSEQALSESESRRARLIATGEWADLMTQKEKKTHETLGVYENRGGSQLVFSDDRLRLLLGISEEEIHHFYEFWVEHLHPDDRERVLTLRREIHENRQDHAFSEYRYLHPQRGLLWLNHVVHVLEREPHGKVFRLVGIIWDVTKNKLIDEALEQSRVQTSAVINSTEDLIWSVDIERFGLLTWNQALRDYFYNCHGFEITVGMSPEQLFSPEYAAQWREFYTCTLRDGSFKTEYEISLQTMILLLSFHVMKRGNKAFGISVFGKDITHRKQTEHKLRESEERLNLAINSAGIGLWIIDMHTHQVWVTPKLRELFNFSSDEKITYDCFFNAIHPEDCDKFRQSIEQSFQTKENFRINHRIVLPEGIIRWIGTRGLPYFTSSGKPEKLMSASLDITEQIHNEEKLSTSKEALRIFTSRLLTIQEEERRHLARELHDDFTQRLAVLAMDMTKVARSIKTKVPEAEHQLTEIREQVVKLSTDIHDISRQLHPSIIADLGLERAIQSECTHFSRRTGITINFKQSNISSAISMDIAVTLFRIVQEALRNIHKHAKVKEAIVSLVEQDNCIILTVEDKGAGFNPENARQTHGLGLFSMQERVQLVHGVLSIDSVRGYGTQIKVTIPLRKI